jgi:hypothetical protein
LKGVSWFVSSREYVSPGRWTVGFRMHGRGGTENEGEFAEEDARARRGPRTDDGDGVDARQTDERARDGAGTPESEDDAA